MIISKRLARIIREFEKHEWYFDEIESYKGGYRFYLPPPYGVIYFETIKEMKDYLRGVVWED